MYGSAKATKPKNIGVKHIKHYNSLLYFDFNPTGSIMTKLYNQKANEVKEDLK